MICADKHLESYSLMVLGPQLIDSLQSGYVIYQVEGDDE